MDMRFTWDEVKRASNIAKHGVDFVDAVMVFTGPFVERPDRRKDYGEDRFEAVGFVDDLCLVVIFARPGGAFRIISARRGGRRDLARYQALFAG
jgi:uncharacterized protein